MTSCFIQATFAAALFAAPVAGLAQSQPQAAPQEAAPSQAPELSPEQRIATLEAELARQTRIADNARQTMGAMRGEMALKDELLILGRDRNAQLFEIAMEIAKKHVRSDDWEPFFQGERIRMENLRQSYEDRLRDARILETTLPPSVQQRMDAELGKAPSAPPKAAPQD